MLSSVQSKKEAGFFFGAGGRGGVVGKRLLEGRGREEIKSSYG